VTPIIDAHVHVWDASRVHYPWLAEARGLRRQYGLPDVHDELRDAGVDGVVLVQAADDPADTDLMLEAARDDDIVAGVVAWAPLVDPPAVARLLEAWAAGPVVGVRHLVHRDPDPGFLLDPRVHDSLELVGGAGLAFDVCAETTDLLALVPRLARQHPTMTFVIDHLAKPPIREQGWHPWAALVTDAAACQNVVAKLSGLNTAASPGWTSRDFVPYVDHALERFGPDRVMYGGDWPFALLNAESYRHVADGLFAVVDHLADDERFALFRGTATRVYDLAGAGRTPPPPDGSR
jgi:L-fuconolactonase